MANKKEFDQFYNKNIDKIYRFVFFHTGMKRELAEDLVSEIFIKVLKNFDNYDENISKISWLMTITKNHLANYWRDSKICLSLPENNFEISKNLLFLANNKDNYSDKELYLMLDKLNDDEKNIVTLHYIFGYNYKEIAEFNKSTEGAIKIMSHRAIKKLKKLL